MLDIAGLIGRRLRTTAMAADTEDVDGWWERVSPAVRREILTGQSALAQMARRYLMAHAEIEGVALEPVVIEPMPRERIDTSMRVTGPVEFKTHMGLSGSDAAARRAMATTLSGAAQRLALSGARDTVMRTFAERDEVAGWRRIGSSPCAFCSMLIGRGAVYSRRSVDFQAHDHDRCTPEPLYRREPDPPDVRRLQERWREVTAGASGGQALAAWRDYWDSR